ncbi:MAG: HAMP domain-containing protein [Rhodobacteraceae bacterium]|nr:HAMP domain-containing protein [Paracoccaceae bacterium]
MTARLFRPLALRSIRSRLLVAISAFLLAVLVSGVVPMIGLRVLDGALSRQYSLTREQLQSTVDLSNAFLHLSSRAPFLVSNVQPPLRKLHARTLNQDLDSLAARINSLCPTEEDCPNGAQLRSEFDKLRFEFAFLVSIADRNSEVRDRIRAQVQAINDRLSRLMADPAVSNYPSQISRLRRIDDLIDSFVVTDSLFHAGELRRETERLLHDMRNELHSVSVHQTLDWVHGELKGNESLFASAQQQLLREQEEQRVLRDIGDSSNRISEAIAQHFSEQLQILEDRVSAARDTIRNGFNLLIGLLILCCAFAAGVGRYVWVHVTGGLKRLSQAMRNLADNNTHVDTATLPFGDDEIGEMSEAFQVFYENKQLIEELIERLQSRSALIESTIKDMRDGFLLTSPDGAILSHNPQFSELLQLDDAVGEDTRIEDWLATSKLPADKVTPLLDNPTAAVIEDAGKFLQIRQSRLPNGRVLWIISDTTSATLLKKRLKRFQRLEDLGLIAGEIAHDVRNILSVLEGYLSLLENDPDLTQSQRRSLRKSRAAVETGTGLTHRLLAFARRQELHSAVIDLNDLVCEIEDILASVLGDGCTLTIDLPPDPICARLDPAQMESALINLCTNAARAIEGDGAVHINLSHQDEDVVIEVTDNGCGMDQNTLDRAIDPFFTLDRSGSGTGLGLSMVYGFVEQSGGQLKLTSEPGKGATVRMTFRKAQALDDLPQGIADLNVLIVDDNKETLAYLHAEFAGKVATCLNADTPCKVRDILDHSEAPIDLILCDLDLGDRQSGWDVLRYAQTTLPHARLFAMSGGERNTYPPSDLSQTCRFFSKPVNVHEILRTVVAD